MIWVLQARTREDADDDGQGQYGQGQDDVDDAHEHGVDRTACVPCDDTDDRADHGRDDRGDDPDEQRDARAVDQHRQQVVTDVVGSRASAPRRGRRTVV